ncbi:MAG: glycine cleavage system protein R, partial [Acidimicrobiales bacterium]
MAQMVITVIGDDRAGLVDALSEVVARHGGNWDRSQMAELAGKFAGIVLATVPDLAVQAVVADLEAVEATGLLDITTEVGDTSTTDDDGRIRLALRLLGQDHVGIVHDISHALAQHGVSIEGLTTEVVPAPMGGSMFRAEAALAAPANVALEDLEAALE